MTELIEKTPTKIEHEELPQTSVKKELEEQVTAPVQVPDKIEKPNEYAI